MESNKTLIVSQARSGSTRLPNKVLLKIDEDTLLGIHLERLGRSQLKDEIIVATTIKENDDQIVSICENHNIKTYRGSEDDVLDRYYNACIGKQASWVVRVTSDCPLIDPVLVDAVIAFAQSQDVDYCSNVIDEGFPDGQDVEVFKFSALEKAWHNAILKSDREHVTSYIRNNSDAKGGSLFKAMNFPSYRNFKDVRMTVDERQDYELIVKLVHDLGKHQTWLAYTNYIIKNDLNSINSGIIRNEGYIKSLKKD